MSKKKTIEKDCTQKVRLDADKFQIGIWTWTGPYYGENLSETFSFKHKENISRIFKTSSSEAHTSQKQ